MTTVVALAVIAVATRWLQLSGGHAPPLSPRRFGPWLTATGPDAAVMAMVRCAGIGLGWYVLATTALSLFARMIRLPGMIRACDALTLPPVRRLLAASLGAGLAVAPLLGVPAGATVTTTTPPVTRSSTARPAGPPPSPPEASAAARAPSLRLLDDHAETMHPLDPPPAPGPGPGSRPGSTPALTSWTVHPGDHFWRIAEQVLIQSGSRPQPTTADVARYWRMLIDRNGGRLAQPANANLIYPAQVFDLPPPPS